MPEQGRIEFLDPKENPNPYISSPGDYLAKWCAEEIRKVKQFKMVFGEFIDGYMRMDYPERALPALRIYNEEQTMDADNWFIVGTLMVDILFPPSLRRFDLQNYIDIVSGAILQQFRRLPFFTAMRGHVPGLNWLGQSITIQKGLAQEWKSDVMIPLCELTVNFRVDLREWDLYLEKSGRTVEDPFEVTLADLASIQTTIAAQNDDGTDADVDLVTLQNV